MAERRKAKISAAWKRLWHSVRSQPLSAAQLPLLLPQRNTSTPSTSSSLIIFIRKEDNLPQQWMLSKRKKHNAGDIQELEEYLEYIHGIRRTSLDVRRPSSASSITPSYSGTGFTHWKAVESFDNTRASSEPVKIPNYNFKTDHTTSTERAITVQTRQDMDLATMAIPRLRRSRTREEWPTLLNQIRACATFLLRLLQVIRRILSLYIVWTWFVMRWPICIVLAKWLFLQDIAITYTITSNAFLSGFCQYRLPIMRDWMCSSWNEFANYRDLASATTTKIINQSFDNILQNTKKTMLYKLLFFISRYQTTIRFFRVSLPKSKYASKNQLFFESKFSKFIDLSNYTIVNAQLFHIHIIDTINSHVSNTKYVM